jgi:hypothetical protein
VNSAYRRYWFYDALGRVTERGVLNQRRRLFGYDTGGRLASVSDSTYFDEVVCTDPEDLNTCQRQTGWNPAGDVNYTYDKVGNRTDSNARLHANTNRLPRLRGRQPGGRREPDAALPDRRRPTPVLEPAGLRPPALLTRPTKNALGCVSRRLAGRDRDRG